MIPIEEIKKAMQDAVEARETRWRAYELDAWSVLLNVGELVKLTDLTEAAKDHLRRAAELIGKRIP